MVTASAGRAARGCRKAPARSARPCSTTASQFPGRAGAKPIKGPGNRSCAQKRGSQHEQPVRRNRRTEDRSRTYRAIPRRAAPPLFSRNSAKTWQQPSRNRSRRRKAIATIPSPAREPEPRPSETPFQYQTPLAKPFKGFRPEPACRSPTSSGAIDGRSPPLVTRRFGASARRPAGHCRAWEGSSNEITRPCCTRSARWRSARPAIPNCSPP